MLAIVMASMLAAASDSVPSQVGSLNKEPVRYCRAMIVGYSRSGDVTICKTKAQWDDFDSCHGITRYCSPEQKAALARQHATAFALTEDSRIVCRIVSVTGSRLRAERTCLPQREWQRMWDNGREEMGKLQDHQSRLSTGAQ
jgi:hypothetical protein